MIEIKKSPTADTRTCDVTKVERQQQSRIPCAECNGIGKLDGDVSYGDGVMAIERDCIYCNGSGVELD